jgi:hypothetical protein
MRYLDDTARFLGSSGHYRNWSREDIIEDLRVTVNIELIKQGSLYFIEGPLSADRGFKTEIRSFWEWLDVPEEIPEDED